MLIERAVKMLIDFNHREKGAPAFHSLWGGLSDDPGGGSKGCRILGSSDGFQTRGCKTLQRREKQRFMRRKKAWKHYLSTEAPRKNWTTVKMLDSAMKGAADAGAETEIIHLYDYNVVGCKSCFACKLKNAKTNGVCAIRDDLRPILEKAHDTDVIVLGSPVYFSYPTGVIRSFMERLMFPILSYNAKVDEETGEAKSSLLGRTVPTAMIYKLQGKTQVEK